MSASGPPAQRTEGGRTAGGRTAGGRAVVVLGAGRVGRALAGVLDRAGSAVVVVPDRRTDPHAAVAAADTVLLTVGDDDLAGVVTDLAAAGSFRPGQLVVHTAGARGTGVLAPAAAAGALTAAVHPVVPFSGDPGADGERVAGAAFGLTADAGALPAARGLLAALGVDPDRIVLVAGADRPAWHAGVCVAANHAFAAVVDGRDRLARLGVAEPGAVLAPVVRAAVGLALGPGAVAHTGPVARGDAGTVAAHLAVPASRDSVAAYRSSARLIADQVAGVGPADRGSTDRPFRVARTRAELDAALAVAPGPRALVMTMGALHPGHLAHVGLARDAVGAAGTVVLSIFVNPLQFGPGEDLDTYPRTLDADLGAARAAGVDLLFAPTVGAVYPNGPPAVRIDPGPLGTQLEGTARPGHFAGMLTVVSRVLRLVDPDVATFGEKDYQQLTLVRAMVADLGPAVRILPVPVVREPDGLAMSSRNARLGAGDRARAAALYRALGAGAVAGPRGGEAVLDKTRAMISRAGITPDSLALRAPDLGPAPATGPARLLLAAVVGGIRLLDNTAVHLGAGSGGRDSAERQPHPEEDR